MYQCMIHMFGIKIDVSYVCKPGNRPTCDSLALEMKNCKHMKFYQHISQTREQLWKQLFQSAILLWWWPNATKVECVVSQVLAVPHAW